MKQSANPPAAEIAPGPRGWRYHAQRDLLLAEAHARPYTPLAPPMLATRVATLSGEDGAEADRLHMVAICRRLGHAEPGPGTRWCGLDAGTWRLRWERHTEFSTWTFFRPSARAHPFAETALDLAPADWLGELPGEVLVAANLELRPRENSPSPAAMLGQDAIGARLLDGAATVFTDFRPDAHGMTRFLVLDTTGDANLCGRLALTLLEIETYRLMALLAFPLASRTGKLLGGIEERAGEIAAQLARPAEHAEDRELLARLVALAGESESLSAATSFRFGAGRAYHGIVRDRIANLREEPVAGLQTLGEFMERRLAPAMRTCDTVAARQTAAIERIARTEQMLNTRVEVAAEATSAALLASMDRRAKLQLRLQRTVEGLSVAAISYYAIGLVGYLAGGLAAVAAVDAKLVVAASVPLVVAAVWVALGRARTRLHHHHDD